MADDTQGKAQQRTDTAAGSNQRAVSKGEAIADARDAQAVKERTTANATATRAARAAPDKRPKAEDIADREAKPYRALERGYVDGRIVEPGEVFVTKADVGMWMEPVKKADTKYGVEAAVDEAGYGKKADVDYDGMSEAALQALAALVGVSKPGELGKDDLVTAIKAARRVDAQ